MQLLAEENLANNIVQSIEHSFVLQPNLHVTFISGQQLNQIPIGQEILENSLKEIKKNYHLNIGKNYEKIISSRLYLTIFEPLANQQNKINLIVPFSANIASILIGALIKKPKDATWTDNDVITNLNTIKNQSFNDVVIYQLFKFYTPDKTKVKTIPKSILEKISYKGFENDSFNMEILFELPITDIYQPLQLKIIKHEKNTNYNESSLAPIKLINYDEKAKTVQLITSLY